MSAGNVWMEIAKRVSGALRQSYKAGEGMTDHLGTMQGTADTTRMAPEAGAAGILPQTTGTGKKGPPKGGAPQAQPSREEQAYKTFQQNPEMMQDFMGMFGGRK